MKLQTTHSPKTSRLHSLHAQKISTPQYEDSLHGEKPFTARHKDMCKHTRTHTTFFLPDTNNAHWRHTIHRATADGNACRILHNAITHHVVPAGQNASANRSAPPCGVDTAHRHNTPPQSAVRYHTPAPPDRQRGRSSEPYNRHMNKTTKTAPVITAISDCPHPAQQQPILPLPTDIATTLSAATVRCY